MLSRRSMLAGMLFAPAVVKAEILMPVKRLIVPEVLTVSWGAHSGLGYWTPAEPYISKRLREMEALYKMQPWKFIPYSAGNVVPFSPEARTELSDA